MRFTGCLVAYVSVPPCALPRVNRTYACSRWIASHHHSGGLKVSSQHRQMQKVYRLITHYAFLRREISLLTCMTGNQLHGRTVSPVSTLIWFVILPSLFRGHSGAGNRYSLRSLEIGFPQIGSFHASTCSLLAVPFQPPLPQSVSPSYFGCSPSTVVALLL